MDYFNEIIVDFIDRITAVKTSILYNLGTLTFSLVSLNI